MPIKTPITGSWVQAVAVIVTLVSGVAFVSSRMTRTEMILVGLTKSVDRLEKSLAIMVPEDVANLRFDSLFKDQAEAGARTDSRFNRVWSAITQLRTRLGDKRAAFDASPDPE